MLRAERHHEFWNCFEVDKWRSSEIKFWLNGRLFSFHWRISLLLDVLKTVGRWFRLNFSQLKLLIYFIEFIYMSKFTYWSNNYVTIFDSISFDGRSKRNEKSSFWSRKSAGGVVPLCKLPTPAFHASDGFYNQEEDKPTKFLITASLHFFSSARAVGKYGSGFLCGAHQKSTRFIHTKIVCGKLGLVTKNNLRVNLLAALPSFEVARVDIEWNCATSKVNQKYFLPRARCLISKTITLLCFTHQCHSWASPFTLSALMTWIYST